MDYERFFVWKSRDEAIKIQEELRKKIILVDGFTNINTVGGVDTSFSNDKALSVIVVMNYKTLELMEVSYHLMEVTVPYMPSFLSFREGPSIIKAWEKLKIKPDILIFDGQGIAHPRRLGIASHVGVVLDIATIGCAKNLLIGDFKEPDNKKGAFSYIYDKGEIIGVVLRSKENVRPVYISPGHKVSLDSSIKILFNCTYKYRLPEPVRLAHIYSKKILLDLKEER
jgi:deoxyribonuclease V